MIKRLLEAAYAYYVKNDPIMSDKEYDTLYEQASKFEEEAGIPEEARVTNKVCLGYFEGKKTTKVQHRSKMLSLEKDNDKVYDKPLVASPKFDGAAIEANYVYGNLQSILSRGNGEYGSDYTKHPIRHIPNYVEEWKDTPFISVRGEAMCDKWEGKTHRNWVAGTLGLLNPNTVKERDIYFIAYYLEPWKATYVDDLEELMANGFLIPDYRILKDSSEFKPWHVTLPIDGFVLRVLDNKDFGQHTSHHYKNIWAWKGFDEQVETTLEYVEWSSSKNNVWTPVAIITPVEIDGTTVSRVNLASMDYIADKDVAIGDKILVRKAKKIIPELVSVVERPANRIPIELDVCPNCGKLLTKTGIYLVCENEECNPAKRVEFFCDSIGIKGLKLKSLEKLKVKEPYELYSLTEEFIVEKLGKVGESIFQSIKESKSASLMQLISALNPPMIKQASLELIFPNIETYRDMYDAEKLKSIKGIGDVKSSTLSLWMRENTATLQKFFELGFSDKVKGVVKNLGNSIVAITGSHSGITRNELKAFLSKKGIELKDDVTKACSLLLIGDKPSQSKMDKATKYGITSVRIEHFLKDIGMQA
jgi:DNA ligase (NAD+)